MKSFKLITAILVLFGCGYVHAQTAVLPVYSCDNPGVKAVTSGASSSNYLQGSIPSCTVTVFLTGTTTKATIYKDSSNTPQNNPFTANTNSSIQPIFAAINQGYDVQLSGGIPPNTYLAPITLTGLYPGTNITIPTSCTGATGPCIVANPSSSQTITQPINTSFNVTVSGTGQVLINGYIVGINGFAFGTGGQSAITADGFNQTVIGPSGINHTSQTTYCNNNASSSVTPCVIWSDGGSNTYLTMDAVHSATPGALHISAASTEKSSGGVAALICNTLDGCGDASQFATFSPTESFYIGNVVTPVPTVTNPVNSAGYLESSIIVDPAGSGSCFIFAYSGSSVNRYTVGGPNCSGAWSSPVSMTGVTHPTYLTVHYIGSTCYITGSNASGSGLTGNTYLYTSTNCLTSSTPSATVANGGNPIWTQTGSGDLSTMYNSAGIAIDKNGVWYSTIDAATSETEYTSYVSSGCPSTCNFNTNVSATGILGGVAEGGGGAPDLIYVQDRNSIVAVYQYGNFYASPSAETPIEADYVSVASSPSNFTTAADWSSAPGFTIASPINQGADTGLSDPTISCGAPSSDIFSCIMLFSYNQASIYVAYISDTLDNWFDKITNASNTTQFNQSRYINTNVVNAVSESIVTTNPATPVSPLYVYGQGAMPTIDDETRVTNPFSTNFRAFQEQVNVQTGNQAVTGTAVGTYNAVDNNNGAATVAGLVGEEINVHGEATTTTTAMTGLKVDGSGGWTVGTDTGISVAARSTGATTKIAINAPYDPSYFAYGSTVKNSGGTAEGVCLSDGSSSNGAGTCGGGSGTVTSVAMTTPGVLFTVAGSPITTSGTLALSLVSQSAYTFLANNTSGSATPTFVTAANAFNTMFEQVATTLGDEVYGGASGAPTRLAGPTGAASTTYFYTNTTNVSSVAQAPAWESPSTARTALGLGTMATQAASSVAITGGTIDGTVIGGTTPAAGTFTNVTVSQANCRAATTITVPCIAYSQLTTGLTSVGGTFTLFTTSAAGVYQLSGTIYPTTTSSTTWYIQDEINGAVQVGDSASTTSIFMGGLVSAAGANIAGAEFSPALNLPASYAIPVQEFTSTGANTGGVFNRLIIVTRLQ